MAIVHFYRGVKANYNSVTHADAIYWCTDTCEIIMNGDTYGKNLDGSQILVGGNSDYANMTIAEFAELVASLADISQSATEAYFTTTV